MKGLNLIIGTHRREDYRQTTTTQPQAGTVLVFDNGGIYTIRREPVGKPWKFKGQFVSCAKKVTYYENGQTKEVFEPYDPLAEWRAKNKDKEGIYTPEDLSDAINWPEAGAVYRMGSGFMQKLNMGLMVALVGILCFFIYVMFSSFVGK